MGTVHSRKAFNIQEVLVHKQLMKINESNTSYCFPAVSYLLRPIATIIIMR